MLPLQLKPVRKTKPAEKHAHITATFVLSFLIMLTDTSSIKKIMYTHPGYPLYLHMIKENQALYNWMSANKKRTLFLELPKSS